MTKSDILKSWEATIPNGSYVEPVLRANGQGYLDGARYGYAQGVKETFCKLTCGHTTCEQYCNKLSEFLKENEKADNR